MRVKGTTTIDRWNNIFWSWFSFFSWDFRKIYICGHFFYGVCADGCSWATVQRFRKKSGSLLRGAILLFPSIVENIYPIRAENQHFFQAFQRSAVAQKQMYDGLRPEVWYKLFSFVWKNHVPKTDLGTQSIHRRSVSGHIHLERPKKVLIFSTNRIM